MSAVTVMVLHSWLHACRGQTATWTGRHTLVFLIAKQSGCCNREWENCVCEREAVLKVHLTV